MYKLAKQNAFGETTTVFYTTEKTHTSIPFDPDNADYQKYLEWVAEGNEPLPADE